MASRRQQNNPRAFVMGTDLPPGEGNACLLGKQGWASTDPLPHPDHHTSCLLNLSISVHKWACSKVCKEEKKKILVDLHEQLNVTGQLQSFIPVYMVYNSVH